jgi:fibronectin type 3 domain-containing protein
MRGYPRAPPTVTIPANFSATAVSKSQINLTWADSANETSYVLERSTNNRSFAAIATPAANATSYADTGLVAGKTYYYRLKAVNSTGSSEYSSTASAPTPRK